MNHAALRRRFWGGVEVDADPRRGRRTSLASLYVIINSLFRQKLGGFPAGSEFMSSM